MISKVEYSGYTADFKIKVIEYAENHVSRAAIHEFTKLECNVHHWWKQKGALLQTINKSRKAF
jgi:hypothetical protein